jgi:hypothetical protein
MATRRGFLTEINPVSAHPFKGTDLPLGLKRDRHNLKPLYGSRGPQTPLPLPKDMSRHLHTGSSPLLNLWQYIEKVWRSNESRANHSLPNYREKYREFAPMTGVPAGRRLESSRGAAVFP